jgi:hypothetical protein
MAILVRGPHEIIHQATAVRLTLSYLQALYFRLVEQVAFARNATNGPTVSLTTRAARHRDRPDLKPTDLPLANRISCCSETRRTQGQPQGSGLPASS